MRLDERIGMLRLSLKGISALKFNALLIAVVATCLLAASFGYCVEISWSEGFSFARCVRKNSPSNSGPSF